MRRNVAQWWDEQRFVDKVLACCVIAVGVLILVSVVRG